MEIQESYKILKVSQGSEWKQIKSAYHSLAKQYHPDLFAGDSSYENQFKKIVLAFKTLEVHYKGRGFWSRWTDRAKRTFLPNKIGNVDVKISSGLEPDPKSADLLSEQTSPHVIPAGWKKFLYDRARRIRKGIHRYEKIFLPHDAQTTITIDSTTAWVGGTLKVHTCAGNVRVKIPRGVYHNMFLRVPGKGDSAYLTGLPGDLLLQIRILSARQFEKGDTDCFYRIKIPKLFVEAGKVLTLETHEGPIKFVVPKNTIDGQTFALKARPVLKNPSPINHIVTVHLV